MIKKLEDYLQEFASKKSQINENTRTKTDFDTDLDSLADLFRSPADQPIAPAAEPAADEPQQAGDADPRARASQASTLRATQGITATPRMSDLLSRMRDIEGEVDDPGYPDPEPPAQDVAVRVTADNLPAVVGANLRAAGVQNPEFHRVANLPGNMGRAIRTLGRQLFRSFTTTGTDDIWTVANLAGQGPNTPAEVNAVAGWVRDNGERVTEGEIDFADSIPDYQADIQQWTAAGIRWLLVRDEFGVYVYSWPESSSLDQIDQPNADVPRLDR